MQVAFLMLAHSNPSLTARFIEKLTEDGDRVFLHVDKRVDLRDFQSALSKFSVEQVEFVKNRVSCFWGGYSLVDATVRGLQQILDSKYAFHFVSLHSSQDYPLLPIRSYKEFLEDNITRSFIDHSELPISGWGEGGGLGRLNRLHLPELLTWMNSFRGGGRVYRWIDKALSKLTRRRRLIYEKFYGGSQWWTLNSSCVEYILDYLKQNPRVSTFFKNTLIPDEIFFQSILANSSLRQNLVNDNLRHILWDQNRPVVFGKRELEALGTTGKYFLRKVNDEAIYEIAQ